MWYESAQAALYIPEFLEADICCKTTLGDVVVEHLQTNSVGNNGRLSYGNVGKGAGMHHARLVLSSAHQRGIDGVAHPGSHSTADFQVAGGYRVALLVKGYGDFVHSLAQVCQVFDY